MKKLVIISILLLVLIALPQSARAVEQQCQYPTRPLVDGKCDNSDPCDPETIKDPVLQGDCRPSVPETRKVETVEPVEYQIWEGK